MNKQLFDAGWEFTDMQGMFGMLSAQWQPVTLPHDLSIARPRSAHNPTGGGGGYAWSGVVTYRKKFAVPAQWENQSLQLEFEGVYMGAKVLVNKNVVALHPYGYTSFLVDLTPHLVYGAENEVVVVANNSAQPNSRWYSGTGIYRHVWLRRGSAIHIQPWGVLVTTPLADAAGSTVSVTTEIANPTGAIAALVLHSIILDAGGNTVAQVETPLEVKANSAVKASQTINLAPARLWSLDNPHLYTLTSQVLVASQVVDAERTTFGIRSIAVDAKQGFRLNGVPLKLKGGCVHHDNGLLGAASYDRAEQRKIELMKSAGYNAIRCAHNPPAPAMLDACDRLGMLVIDETFDCWRMGKNPNDYHIFFEDWWQRDTKSMLSRDFNHPSIIMWSIGNEVGERTGASDGYAWCRKQADFVRSLDPTRFVTSALPALFEENQSTNTEMNLEAMFEFMSGKLTDPQNDRWGTLTAKFAEPLDVVGYNYLVNRYDMDGEKFPNRVMCATETFPHWAFAFWEATSRLPYLIGDFVWTSLDYLGESGIGQVTLDGSMWFSAQYPYHFANCGDFDICGFKRPQSYYRDILWGVRTAPYIAVLEPQHHAKQITFNPWGWEPVIHNWSFPGWEGQPAQVEVYSADEEVELLLNGISLGRQPAGAAHKNKAVFQVTYQPGTLAAVGYTRGQATGRDSLATAAAPIGLRLTPDRESLSSHYGDLAYITVEIVDQHGEVVKHAEHTVTFELSGAGELIAVGAANPLSEELYTGSQRKAFQGRLMAVVRTTGQAGEMRLKASADGIKPSQARLVVK